MSQTNSTISGTKKLIKTVVLINSFLILFCSFFGFLKGHYFYYIIGIWAIISFGITGYAVIKKAMDLKLFLVYLFIAFCLIGLTFYQQFKR
jgi:hypothetical protein